MTPRPLTYRDIQTILTQLGDSAGKIVLVGGQALNFWAEHYLDRVCAREFVSDLLAMGHTRPALDLAERVFHLCHDHLHAREVYTRFGVDPFDAVVPDTRLPTAFCATRYPQMAARLAARRRGTITPSE